MKYATMISDTNDFESKWMVEKLMENIQSILEENQGKVFLITIEEIEKVLTL